MMPTLMPATMSPMIYSLKRYRGSQDRTGIQPSTVRFNLGPEHLTPGGKGWWMEELGEEENQRGELINIFL